jgi:hypothetical protein
MSRQSRLQSYPLIDLWRWRHWRPLDCCTHYSRTRGRTGEKNLNDEQMGGADDEESLYVTHNIMISVRPIENWLFDVDGPGFFF